MVDPHLNIFYTYERDDLLKEDNLTRALISVLSNISPKTQKKFLTEILNVGRRYLRLDDKLNDLELSDLVYSLQGNIDRKITRNANRKILLLISTNHFDPGGDELDQMTDNDSRPDAWISKDDKSFCFLIEVKVGSYPLNNKQLQNHTKRWFSTNLDEMIKSNLVCTVTWYDILEIIEELNNDQIEITERNLIKNLYDFIGYYNYRLFKGFQLQKLINPPHLIILHDHVRFQSLVAENELDFQGFSFTGLLEEPGFVFLQ